MNMVFKSNGTERELEKNRDSGSHSQSSHSRNSIDGKFTMEKFKDGKRSEKQGKSPEVELLHGKKAVKGLVLKIEQSNAQVNSGKLELQSLGSATHGGGEEPHYEELLQQLTCLRQELKKLKLDVSSVLESKSKAEKDFEFYNGKTSSSLNKAEELMKEIDEANEEHVLVELARIEAERELREIESQRAAERLEFSKKMEATNRKISDVRREISRGKGIEQKLAATNTDIRVLQNEMELVRAMEKNLQKEILEGAEKKKRSGEEELRVVEEELSNAKRELERIKDEGFQFMASMDVVREELLQVSRETDRMKKLEKDTESRIERLNSRLMKERSKLEWATSSEERTRGIITNLSNALQQLQTEVDTAKDEKEKVRTETSGVKEEVMNIEMDVKSKQKKLEGMISELGEVKASEAAALVKLKTMMEKTVMSRAMNSQNSAMIWVSNWEYEYLTKTGEAAHAVADKKIAAINGWIEAVRKQEKEMLLKTERIEKEIKEMIAAEEEKSVVVQKTMEEEGNELADMISAGISATPIKLNGEQSMSGNRRKSKHRRASSMAGSVRIAGRSPSITIKKRKRVMPNLGTILRVGRGRNKRDEVNIDSYASLLLAPE
ncbi:Protein PLASTID MOVEMENT IMPAIRED 15 [Platanthera zijinensis]|uniref:Protein PLASTID MOVEMENT IMPAIRED 15 n=1 Tax=Platanthera zijinensis TaxID=2320716 RepID=A0AAP0BSS9_9ASPA